MKKAIVGLVALGAIVGLRPVVRRLRRNMHEHCAKMAARCKDLSGPLAGAQ